MYFAPKIRPQRHGLSAPRPTGPGLSPGRSPGRSPLLLRPSITVTSSNGTLLEISRKESFLQRRLSTFSATPSNDFTKTNRSYSAVSNSTSQ